jgi:hypothetical protein
MPIRQNILRKGKAPKQDLLQFDVFRDETGVLGDLTTSEFFNISDFPSVLPTGNSSFLIEGSNLLKPEVELKTEILDAQGNPIFHYAIPGYDKELPSRRIAVEVYQDDVVNGVGTLTILGELDPKQFNIPTAFQNTYNVRFSAPISINKTIKNTEPIRFYGDPTISVSELVKGVAETVSSVDNLTTTITGSVEAIVDKTTIISTLPNPYIPDVQKFEEVGNSLQKYKGKKLGKNKQSSILPPRPTTTTKRSVTYVLKELESSNDNPSNKLSSTLKGATITFQNPNLTARDSSNQSLSGTEFTLPTTFETDILDIENSTTFTTTTDYIVTDNSTNQNQKAGLNSTPVTMSFESQNVGVVESQVFKRSFANMTVGNLQTFSGDTYKAKIYMKEDGSSGEFEPIYETLVESQNELVDIGSVSGFDGVGNFTTQSTIDNNWITSSNLASATTNDDTIIDGVLLSGSNEANGDTFTFVTKDVYSLQNNQPYLVEFKTAAKQADKTQSDGTTNKDARLEVFLTGPITSEIGEELSLGDVDLSEIDLSNNDFVELNKLQIADFQSHNLTSLPSGSLGFRVHAGEFILSDVRLRPFSETNFSPGFFKANVPMPKAVKRGQKYDFLVEFYDANNNLAEAVAIADDVVFNGPPQIIADGTDGLLTGSMFLGSVTGSGIEVHGGSAYIRSIGYNGFDRTIGENLGGFMMFSGSVSESINTSQSYDGVGLEIVDAHGTTDRFLKFRTNPSEFTVQTDQFFLGKDGQFISGSNGSIVISSSNFFLGGENTFVSGANDKLEISSSNFHLDNDGSVIMQGTITAEAGGTIGGFTIGSSSLAAGNVFQLSSSTNVEDPVSFISSSAFKVSAGGIITGSNILLTGGTITSGVTVEGTFSANSILTPATIAGNPTTVANASASIDANGNAVFRSGSIGGFNMDADTLFSDSAEFVVTGSTGQITGSQVLFTGGKIGGFSIVGSAADVVDAIHSTDKKLILSGSGQITGSNFLFDGGKIGGFEVVGNATNVVDAIHSTDKSLILSGSGVITGSQVFFDGGRIGGFAILGNATNVVDAIRSEDSSLILSGSGQITGSTVLFDGGKIGGFTLTENSISSSNNNLRLKDNGQITGSDVLFDGGVIGGFALTDNAISSSNDNLRLKDNGQITGSEVLFSGGEIGGFLITDNTIETKDFASGLRGIRLSTADNGSLEVEEAKIRGTLSTTVFEKESINAVGGQLVVANSTVITGSSVFPSGSFGSNDTTMSVVNSSGFVNGEILVIKKVTGTGFTTEYVQVDSASRLSTDENDLTGLLMVTRSLNDEFEPSKHSGSLSEVTASAQSYEPGQVVVSTGRLGTGYIRLNANPSDTTTPYIDIVERTGSKVFEVDLKARLGDLSGLSSAQVGSNPGFGLFSENVFLTGKISATSGDIGGFGISDSTVSSSNEQLILKDNGQITASAAKISGDITITSGDLAGIDADSISGSSTIVSASAAAGQSGSIAFDAHATQVVLSSAGMDVKNTSAQTIASFGASAKLFGGANNTSDFAEVNGNGMIVVANSETSSIMDNAGTTIMGGTATASLNSDGLTLISAGVTGSLISATTSSMFGASSNDRVEVTDTGLKVYESNKQMLNVGAAGLSIFDTSNNLVSNFGSDVHLNAGNIYLGVTGSSGDWIQIGSSQILIKRNNSNKLRIRDNGVQMLGSDVNSYLLINGDGITLTDNNVTGSIINSDGMAIFGSSGQTTASFNSDGITLATGGRTGSLFTTETSSMFGSSDKHERVELVGTGMKVYENNTQVASFGSSILLPVGDIIVGNTSAQHIDISSDVFAVKNAGTTHVAMGNTDKASLTLNSTNTTDSSSFMAAPSRTVTAGSGVTGLKVDSEAIINDLFVTDDTNLGGSELTASSNATTTILNDLRYFGTASQANTAADENVIGNDVVFVHESIYDGGDQENDFGANVTPYRFVGNFKSGNNPAINMRNMRDGTFTIQSNLTKVGTNDRPRDKRHAALFIGVNDDTKTRTTSGDILDHYAFIHAAGNSNEGDTSTKFQVDVSGSVIAAGNISAFGSSFLSLSDKRWKTDITTFSGSLDKILQLKPRKFKWIKDNKEDYGFIAQEVEKVLPNLVDETSYVEVGDMTEQDTKPYKSVDYSKLTPYLVDTIQQLTKRIEDLEKKVK